MSIILTIELHRATGNIMHYSEQIEKEEEARRLIMCKSITTGNILANHITVSNIDFDGVFADSSLVAINKATSAFNKLSDAMHETCQPEFSPYCKPKWIGIDRILALASRGRFSVFSYKRYMMIKKINELEQSTWLEF